MTIDHYIVFIGAGAPLADELFSIQKRIAKSKVVAPAVKKKYVGTTGTAVKVTSNKLYDELAVEDRVSRRLDFISGCMNQQILINSGWFGLRLVTRLG